MPDSDLLDALTTDLPADERERLTLVMKQAAEQQRIEAEAANPPRQSRRIRRG